MPLPFGQSLPQPLELIALSLTPFSWRRGIGEQLRSGLDPAWILNRLLSDKPKQQGLDRPALLSRASAAMSRAAESTPRASPLTMTMPRAARSPASRSATARL